MPKISKFKKWWKYNWDTVATVAGFLAVIGFIGIGAYVATYYGHDAIVYEDDKITCYDDSTHNEENVRQNNYCLNRDGHIVCRYNYARGRGNNPGDGCYS
jgi:hypothetical protein